MVETKFNVGMTCEGCASAVKRILSKMDGVEKVETDVAAKTVVVQSSEAATPESMLEKLEKVNACDQYSSFLC